ncbi:MAG TPA: hypothetical protein VHC20_03900, partial [Candidatus Paceibacterota bacterium]|nr:hypothetical protein [Candidatus Paceibacterota bacterium]
HLGVDECAELHRVEMSPPAAANIVTWRLALTARAAQAYGAVDADMNIVTVSSGSSSSTRLTVHGL